MTLGEVQAFIQYSRQFTQPLTQVASMMNLLQSGVASAERVFELLDADEQVPDATTVLASPAATGEVRFEHVSFSYDPDRAADRGPVPGRQPRADGRDRRPDRRRQDHAGQPGDAVLRARRRAGSPSTASTSPRCRAPRCAAGSGWCSRTPGCSRARSATTSPTAGRTPPRRRSSRRRGRRSWTGSCTRCPTATTPSIDEDGGNLSAGERQLLTIARAFLSDPALLILDEATSSVDTRTELLLQHAMAALRTDRTSFVIAHRLSTIRDADLILVMEDGRIVEQGTTSRCSPRDGAYAGSTSSQFAAASPEHPGGQTPCRCCRLPPTLVVHGKGGGPRNEFFEDA